MKIKALRLKEVGPFRDGVALEGLTGGLDVLAGPNEFGKSTLFRALNILIKEKHTATGKALQRLQPDRGGAPLIEADLEIDGRLWRLRKRFLAQRGAELQDIATGRLWRGADAENKAHELLSAGGRDVLRGLVWVGQMESFALPGGSGGLDASLTGLIERETSRAAGTSVARAVRARLADMLGELITVSRGKPRVGGPLEAAMVARDELARRLDAARQRVESAEARRRRLADIQGERVRLFGPDRADELERSLAAAARKLEEAKRAQEHVRSNEERSTARRLAVEAATKALVTRERDLDEERRLKSAIEDAATQAEGLARDMEALDAEIEHVAARRNDRRQALARLRKARAHLDAAAARQRLAVADEANAGIADLRAALDDNRVRERHVSEIRRLAGSVAAATAARDAASPRVVVRYLPDAAGRLQISGTVLDAGREVIVDRPIEIAIDGVGVLTVSPGMHGAMDPALALADATRGLVEALAQLGVADVATAEAALEQRQRDATALAEQEARLRASAPEGVGRLTATVGAYEARDASDNPDEFAAIDGTDLDAQLDIAARDVEENERILSDLSSRHDAGGRDTARRGAEIAALRERLVACEAALPAREHRAGDLETLRSTVAASSAALDETIRERAAWAAIVPDAAGMRALADELTAAERAVRVFNDGRVQSERAVATLEGELRREGEDGTEAQVAALNEEWEAACARVADIELDVASMVLLNERLEAAQSRQRDEVLRPVIARLGPQLEAVLGSTAVELAGPLDVGVIERSGRQEAFGQLSDGTREQVAVAVRIAYADLIADRGAAMPLILDDALVFADDERLARMMDLLAAASARHQVIVLSCRTVALGAIMSRLDVRPAVLSAWSDSEAGDVSAQRRTG